jgi:hypothetical protein
MLKLPLEDRGGIYSSPSNGEIRPEGRTSKVFSLGRAGFSVPGITGQRSFAGEGGWLQWESTTGVVG